ncbi:hypothetical protein N510_000730 [Firmicutes bacterium ASF500]|nr:hypothetical protein N510_000730 [Firmicutes bacterium ASF500]
MNKELLDSMRKQMSPSPEARAALTEKLAQPVKKRPIPWMRYGAVAACAALVVGVFTIYQVGKPRDYPLISKVPIHSYVTVEGLTGTIQENATTTETGGGDTGAPNTGALPAPNTGDLPGGTYIGDAPSQEEAVNAYEKLMDRFDGQYPDWYGGAYIDHSGWLVVQLVEDKDPADKSLELQVLDWTDDGHIMFSSCKYSLSYLRDLQDKVCDAMIELGLFSSCGADEERNRLDLTLTSVTDEALILLAKLDPNDDAIYVQVGQRAVADVGTEDPVSHDIMPGGTTVPNDEDLIAEEPQVDSLDGAHYDIRDLPEEKKPAATDFAPEEDVSTSSWFPQD